MSKKDVLLKVLREKYLNLRFEFSNTDELEYFLIYKDSKSNEYLKSCNKEMRRKIDDICEEILTDEELEELVIVYDVLNEIKDIFEEEDILEIINKNPTSYENLNTQLEIDKIEVMNYKDVWFNTTLEMKDIMEAKAFSNFKKEKKCYTTSETQEGFTMAS